MTRPPSQTPAHKPAPSSRFSGAHKCLLTPCGHRGICPGPAARAQLLLRDVLASKRFPTTYPWAPPYNPRRQGETGVPSHFTNEWQCPAIQSQIHHEFFTCTSDLYKAALRFFQPHKLSEWRGDLPQARVNPGRGTPSEQVTPRPHTDQENREDHLKREN